jgi:acyl carrier protein
VTAALLVAVGGTPLDPAELTPGEADQLTAVPGAARRRSWLRARRAFRAALTGCGRDADTSAWRFPSPVASLSHSTDLAVAAVLPGPAGPVAGVGVDLELDRTPDRRTARFFLTDAELGWLHTLPVRARPPALLRLWTVKEAVFKADPANADGALGHYAVADPAASRGTALRRYRAGRPVDHRGLRFHYISHPLARGFLSVALAHSPSWRGDPVQTVDFEQMAARISSLVAIPVERLTPDATIAELVPDSFMFVEVAVDLQEEFDVVLSQRDLAGVSTLGDLAVLLRSRQDAHAAD